MFSAKPQTFTPVYLHREYTMPPFYVTTHPERPPYGNGEGWRQPEVPRPSTAFAGGYQDYDYDGTSYTSMNEWLHMPDKNQLTQQPPKPMVSTLNDWRTLPQREPGEGEEDEDQYLDLPRPEGPEDNYKRTYDNLTQQIAYRWPNPGSPRMREGRIGGTWRHIKEVLGHGGSRVVFVDGLVSVYDQQKFTQKLQAQLPYRPHIQPLYAAAKAELTPRGSFSKHPVLPDVAKPTVSSHMRDPNLEKKLQLQERFPRTRRGTYGYP